MRIVVTGGAGFIGSHLVKMLLEQEHSVSVIDDLSVGQRENIPSGATLFVHDIVQPSSGQAIKAAKPHIIVHLAAHANIANGNQDVIDSTAVNVLGTVNMLKAAKEYDVQRFVFASSAAVYGNAEIIPSPEHLPLHPLGPYGMAKAAAEIYVNNWARHASISTLALRLANVYGPKQRYGVIPAFMTALARGARCCVRGNGKQTRDFVFVDDVAWAFSQAAMDWTINGVLNIGTGKETSVNELRRILGLAMGKTRPGFMIDPSVPGEITRSALDPRRAVQSLQWCAVKMLEEGIAEMVNKK